MPPVRPASRAERPLEPELLDSPLPLGEARRALRDLDRVNRWTLGLGGVCRTLLPRLAGDGRPGEGRLLLDLGTGAGLAPVEVARRARSRGVALGVVGVDRRLAHLVVGREMGRSHPRVVASVEALPFRDGAFDWTMSHLVFHHFGGDDNRRIVGEMLRCSARGSVVVDLRRSRLAEFLIRLLFPFLRIGRVATSDGILSARQAWTVDEVAELAAGAGWTVSELRRRFPFRWSLVLTRPRS